MRAGRSFNLSEKGPENLRPACDRAVARDYAFADPGDPALWSSPDTDGAKPPLPGKAPQCTQPEQTLGLELRSCLIGF
jgi:hypothetical protein